MKVLYNINVRKVRNIPQSERRCIYGISKSNIKRSDNNTNRDKEETGNKNGDKVLFVEEAGKIYILNSSMDALNEAQSAFKGEAERLGLKNDDDVVRMIKELREEG